MINYLNFKKVVDSNYQIFYTFVVFFEVTIELFRKINVFILI